MSQSDLESSLSNDKRKRDRGVCADGIVVYLKRSFRAMFIGDLWRVRILNLFMLLTPLALMSEGAGWGKVIFPYLA